MENFYPSVTSEFQHQMLLSLAEENGQTISGSERNIYPFVCHTVQPSSHRFIIFTLYEQK
jgi:hypothetical protein